MQLWGEGIVPSRGICVVAKETAAKSQRSNIRLVRSPFFADVVCDTHSHPSVHHWIVQREGSPDIVQWGQEASLEEAESAAAAYLDELVERERKTG